MSSRYLKDLEMRKSKIIHIYRNGDPYTRACFVILRLIEQGELERIIRAIEEKVKLPRNKPIRKLFEISGTIVQSPIQIKDGNYYVAASAENFSAVEYGHPKNWILVGPVKSNKYENVHYVTKAEEEGKSTVLSLSVNPLFSVKAKNQNATEKKSKRHSGDKSKKELRPKKYAKNMISSEHADVILGDGEADMLNNQPHLHSEVKESNDVEHEATLDNENNGKKILSNGDKMNEEMHAEAKLSEVVKEDIETSDKIKEDTESSEVIQHEAKSEELIEETTEPSEVRQANDKSEELVQEEVASSEIIQEDKEKTESHNKEESDKVLMACDTDQPNLEEHQSDQQEDNTDHPSNDSALEKSQNQEDQVDSTPVENESNDSPLVKENSDEIDSKIPQDFDDENKVSTDVISDEVYNHAATKIQATFRGYQVRNEIGKTKTSDFPDDSIDENPSLSEATNVEDSL